MRIPPAVSDTAAAPKVCLAVVDYNQAVEIGDVLRVLRSFHPIADTIVVDDGSTDGSAEIAERLGYTVIRHVVNRGVGAAVRTGIQEARQRGYDVFAVMSANGKTRPQDLPVVLAPIVRNEADYVTGSRFIAGGASPGLGFFRRLAIPLFSAFTAPLLGRWFSDITCGFRAYKLTLFDDPDVAIDQPWLDRYEMEYYIHWWACRKRLRIKEVPVIIPYRHLAAGRRSHIRPISGWWRMIRPFVLLTFRIRR